MPNRRRDLNARLMVHFDATRASFDGGALKRNAANWQIYAAVTGSALALATNASAAAIVYSGAPVMTSPPLVTSVVATRTAIVQLTGGPSFRIGVRQGQGDALYGTAFLEGGVNFLGTGYSFVRNLKTNPVSVGFGAGIFGASRVARQIRGTTFSGTINNLVSHPFLYKSGWAASKTGIAGFSFTRNTGSGVQTDYGWVRLEYFVGPEGSANQIEALGWAYDNSGNPISPGQPTPSAPEPSTAAMALLAAGAAGVAALRRRRKSAA